MVRIVMGIFWATAVALAGCSPLPTSATASHHTPPASPAETRSVQEAVKSRLYAFHRRWRGVPYRLGGLSRRGVDCSGFVYLAFKSEFGIDLPRTTRAQARAGMPVHLDRLRAGDLVFFKTRPFTRHVGIFIEDGRFLHASTSQGVTISRLDHRYWRSRFWKAVRIPGMAR